MRKGPGKTYLLAPLLAVLCGALVDEPKGTSGKNAVRQVQDTAAGLEISDAYSPSRLEPAVGLTPQVAKFSLVVKRDDTVVRIAPKRQARRRGVVMKGARLPVLGTAEGPGCNREWYNIHFEAWICGDRVTPSHSEPSGKRYPIVAEGTFTPWPYAFVRDAAIEYRVRHGELIENRELLKGFGFGVHGRISVSGIDFLRTVKGTLVPSSAVRITHRISTFSGMKIDRDTPWPLGFVNAKKTWVYKNPSLKSQYRLGKVHRYTPFQALEVKSTGSKKFVKFDENAWLLYRDVRIASMAQVPNGIRENEKWIDVDVDQQIITAYEGARPVYVTLVSTGRVGPSKTIKGAYRIWAKVAAIAMDNTDEEIAEGDVESVDAGPLDEQKLYSLHDVPWAQFFFESYGLHGVYWHDRFGNRRSHGCVNLSAKDARWFFDWTEPRLPEGWWAMHTSPGAPGTLVRVR
ncbi:MAG: L,D-transpeptidase [Myxococcota bacterium]|nr:L,D-transpeptidase [Myxococcota bacterium]